MASNNTEKQKFTFHHPELGPLTGLVQPDNVVQFRAVPYASIPARFKRSILLESLLQGENNHTEYGHFHKQQRREEESTGASLHPRRRLRPRQNRRPALHRPDGSTIDQQWPTHRLRIHPVPPRRFSYLHTSSADSNLALNDQRNALLWIQRFISGFGGDEKRVTVFGESAGSISICYHMLKEPPSSGPLFDRAVLMSGIIGPSTAPCEVGDAEKRYDAFLTRLGIEKRGDEGLRKLREVDVERVVAASAEMGDEGGMWLAVRDKEWFDGDKERVTWDRIPELIGECKWVNDIILGCTSFEGTTFASRYADVKPDAFLSSIKDQLGEESAQIVAKAYNITSTMDQNLFLTSLLRWVGDAIFDAPNHMLATHLSTVSVASRVVASGASEGKKAKNVYRYIFNVRNPFPNNVLYQQPHHWVDIYFIFKAHQFRFPSERLKSISTKHAQLWIDFANGKKPWAEYVSSGKGDEVAMLADEREGWVEKSVNEVEGELEWGYGRCEELVRSWEGKKGGEWAPLDLKCLKGVKKT
ncbi:alpha/beta-hydrolase [Macroventuria anomochaeta]|uniref:Alpha/beta-hydrolase n=1 Tax=Macroventuria anomochaeta TaxID=301207 RepID=A0ACB6SGS1_9PLEO|nr:alpha/beta-hydrolase [Macroventuria anomochaeta]KAF2633495.1 alpha/beta-hydrolase [Macroventuria anomochaeta]